MTGEPIAAVRNGLDLLVSTLRQDPYALETAYLSIITFDNDARQVVPLTELADFQVPQIEATGMTALGAALTLAGEAMFREVQRASKDQRGDWKPIVFLMTDGMPNDDWEAALDTFRAAKPGMVVACGAGPQADRTTLEQITESVVMLDTADASTISAFFKWVSASISTSSQKVDLRKDDIGTLDELPPPPPEIRLT
jgi:uncharacterized protein YegL